MQEVTRITAVRHGETAWNAQARLQGQFDVPLNARGQRQAGRLAQALADDVPHTICTSDLLRARETAQIIAAALHRPVTLAPGLRERDFGLWQGHTYAEVEQCWPEMALRWRRREPDFGPPQGETLQQFSARVVAAASRLAAAHGGQTVLVVAHGGVLDCLYRHALGLALDAPRTWELPNAAINRLLYTGERFTVVGWADAQHLEGVALDEAQDLRPGGSLS